MHVLYNVEAPDVKPCGMKGRDPAISGIFYVISGCNDMLFFCHVMSLKLDKDPV